MRRIKDNGESLNGSLNLCCCSEKPRPLPATLRKLQNEHDTILNQSRTLLESMKRTGNKELSKTMTVRDLTRLKNLVNEHQMKEEQILIPIVDRYLDTKASESIRREHKELSRTLLQLNVKLNRINCSNESRRAFVRSITEFNLIARKHFSREENVIYWYARLCLSQPHDSTRVK